VLNLALAFLVLALAAALFGFGLLVAPGTWLWQAAFFVCLVLFVGSLIGSLRTPPTA
jgi:uncharacterized membrane protein YtjA (UPF0391 family)